MEGTSELPSQALEDNDEIVFIADFGANETKTLTVRYGTEGKSNKDYKQRANVELSMKDGNGWKDLTHVRAQDHSPTLADHLYIYRFEGPGWESDRVGYRLYMDNRNAIDIFGKKQIGIFLPQVGLDGYDSYHVDAPWGQDMYKVGEALGLGALGAWTGSKAERISGTTDMMADVIEDGPIYAQLRMTYKGWKGGTATSHLSITADSRMTRHAITIDGNITNVCTAIVKNSNEGAVLKGSSGAWSYYATYGEFSVLEEGTSLTDRLGTGIFYRTAEVSQTTTDSLNHVLVFASSNKKPEFYFTAAWQKEPQGITTREGFESYLKETVKLLDSPLVTEIL